MTELLGKHMEARPSRRQGTKTSQWDIYSCSQNVRLGAIYWSGRWRQYTFWPDDATTFNVECLAALTEFLRCKNAEHRLRKAAGREASGG